MGFAKKDCSKFLKKKKVTSKIKIKPKNLLKKKPNIPSFLFEGVKLYAESVITDVFLGEIEKRGGIVLEPEYIGPGSPYDNCKKAQSKKKTKSAKDNEQVKVKDDKKNDKKKCNKKKRAKEYTKNRPSYRKGVVETVWNNAKSTSLDGKVRDPHTQEVLTWDKTKSRFDQWHMGHKPGKSYKSLLQKYRNCTITKQKFLDEYSNTKNYYPESPSENMSKKHDIN